MSLTLYSAGRASGRGGGLLLASLTTRPQGCQQAGSGGGKVDSGAAWRRSELHQHAHLITNHCSTPPALGFKGGLPSALRALLLLPNNTHPATGWRVRLSTGSTSRWGRAAERWWTSCGRCTSR